MNLLVNILLAIGKAHTVPHRALDCRPGLGGLNQVYGPNRPRITSLPDAHTRLSLTS